MTRRGSEWSLITRVGELVTAELINTPRRDTVNPTRITDRDAPHTSNDPWPITRARNLIFKNVHTVLHMHACTHVRGSGLKNSGHSSPLIYHFLRFPPMAASLLWWQAVANAITLLEREREGGGRREREKEETFNNIITKEKKRKEIFSDIFWEKNLAASLRLVIISCFFFRMIADHYPTWNFESSEVERRGRGWGDFD